MKVLQKLTNGEELSGGMKLINKMLSTQSLPADFTRPMDNLRLAQNLFQLMLKENGIGLAANQAGINIRLFVMYVDKEAFHCFNPEILEFGTVSVVAKEGCLSFPGEFCQIDRPDYIKVKFSNARGIYQERDFTGLASRCFQHELDHLNGVTMYDRIKVNV